jgi:hypothetical protein
MARSPASIRGAVAGLDQAGLDADLDDAELSGRHDRHHPSAG